MSLGETLGFKKDSCLLYLMKICLDFFVKVGGDRGILASVLSKWNINLEFPIKETITLTLTKESKPKNLENCSSIFSDIK